MKVMEIKDCYNSITYIVRADKIRGAHIINTEGAKSYALLTEQLSGGSLYPCDELRVSKTEFETAMRLIKDL